MENKISPGGTSEGLVEREAIFSITFTPPVQDSAPDIDAVNELYPRVLTSLLGME